MDNVHWSINPFPLKNPPPPPHTHTHTLYFPSDISVNLKNIKVFSSLTTSYLLKVTKFLVKISQFELLVMAEKNIFVL